MITAVLARYRVGWAHSDQRQEVEASSPREAAEKWLTGHTDDTSTIIHIYRRNSNAVSVTGPDGATKRFRMTARIVWAAEEVQ